MLLLMNDVANSGFVFANAGVHCHVITVSKVRICIAGYKIYQQISTATAMEGAHAGQRP